MSDDLVDCVAKAMCGCEGICFTSCGTEPCQMAEENYAKAARAAIAVVLEKAAKVAENASFHFTQTTPSTVEVVDVRHTIAAAIRAMIQKEQNND